MSSHKLGQVVQQRSAQGELEGQRAQIREFAQTKKQLEAEVEELRELLETVKTEATSTFPMYCNAILAILTKYRC